MAAFFMTSENYVGKGALEEASARLGTFGTKALIVTDNILATTPIMQKLKDVLAQQNINYVIFDKTVPNPTVQNVTDGEQAYKENACDFIISFGGGSPHDCAKGIALVATNGGNIKEYEGMDISQKPHANLVSINTTAGTASEITRFTVITDTDRKVKMAILDTKMTPKLSVNDPELMLSVPASLTAATGMDALTHAIEAYVSVIATPLTDGNAIQSIKLIAKYLKKAVDNGNDIDAREQMAYAQLLAGLAFNNASVGYVHAMAHQLGGFYNLPHGVCNALLLPYVQKYNAQACAGRLKDIAEFMGKDVSGLSDNDGANVALDAIIELSKSIGIPQSLSELGVKEADIPTLAENAMKDICCFTNPVQGTQADIEAIYREAM